MKKEFWVILVIIILIALAFVFFQFNILGNVIDDGEEEVSRYIYYDDLRVFPKEQYAGSCYPKGEVMPVLPDQQCCEGLQQLGIIDSAIEGCSYVTGVALCSECGNSQCDYGENECNCPEDCNVPPRRV